jgi:hypothetical protein
VAYLDHGSFGACPGGVLEYQLPNAATGVNTVLRSLTLATRSHQPAAISRR